MITNQGNNIVKGHRRRCNPVQENHRRSAALIDSNVKKRGAGKAQDIKKAHVPSNTTQCHNDGQIVTFATIRLELDRSRIVA